MLAFLAYAMRLSAGRTLPILGNCEKYLSRFSVNTTSKSELGEYEEVDSEHVADSRLGPPFVVADPPSIMWTVTITQ
ncbi:MAG: hypothetical protein HOI35_15845 [Woeseia sp.]|jgi:hypothetical protein|nr:hypothetical protein [Woeseia sp.]